MEPRDREMETKEKTLQKLEDGMRRCDTNRVPEGEVILADKSRKNTELFGSQKH